MFILQCQNEKEKKLPNCQKKENAVRVILIVFDGVLCDLRAYTGTVFTFTHHELGTRRTITISWLLTVYSKYLSSQCKFTAIRTSAG